MAEADRQMEKNIVVSRRLKMLADLVTPGSVVADVGCDHGFLSIYLVQQGICPHVIAADVRKGPLEGARLHIRAAGLEAYIETRLSDGVKAFSPGEADSLVCAGMGGRLMQQILMDCPETTVSFRELILQPQSELYAFRRFLRSQGWAVEEERILREDGKYYFPMKVVLKGEKAEEPFAENRLYDKFGKALLQRREPVLKEYLEKCLAECRKVEATLLGNLENSVNRKRLEESLAENQGEIRDLLRALDYFA